MNEPFQIERLAERRVVVRFSSWVSDACTQAQSDRLAAVLEEADTLVFDLSGTELLGSDWWRCIGRMGRKAARTGQRVVAVGVHEVLRTTADAVLVAGDVTFVPTLADAWA